MCYWSLILTPINPSLEPVVVQPPVDVLLEFINASAVLISWSYPDEDKSNPVLFLVRYSHDGDPYVNAATQPIGERSYVFSGMQYGGYYQFQVVAIQGRTTSQPATTDYFINGITGKTGWVLVVVWLTCILCMSPPASQHVWSPTANPKSYYTCSSEKWVQFWMLRSVTIKYHTKWYWWPSICKSG